MGSGTSQRPYNNPVTFQRKKNETEFLRSIQQVADGPNGRGDIASQDLCLLWRGWRMKVGVESGFRVFSATSMAERIRVWGLGFSGLWCLRFSFLLGRGGAGLRGFRDYDFFPPEGRSLALVGAGPPVRPYSVLLPFGSFYLAGLLSKPPSSSPGLDSGKST